MKINDKSTQKYSQTMSEISTAKILIFEKKLLLLNV